MLAATSFCSSDHKPRYSNEQTHHCKYIWLLQIFQSRKRVVVSASFLPDAAFQVEVRSDLLIVFCPQQKDNNKQPFRWKV